MARRNDLKSQCWECTWADDFGYPGYAEDLAGFIDATLAVVDRDNISGTLYIEAQGPKGSRTAVQYHRKRFGRKPAVVSKWREVARYA